MAEMDTFEQPSTPSVDAASVMAGPQPVANSSNEGTAAPAQPSPAQPASEQQAPQPVKAPQPNAAAAAAAPNGTAVSGAAVTARPAVTDHPAVQRAGLLHSIAESLAGGPRYKTSIDVNTGATTRTAVPLSGREIGMAIALEAISGSLAGLQGGRGRGAGGAGMAGLNQGQKIAQMRQQKQQEEDQRASGDYARQAAITQTNMKMAQNQIFLAQASHDIHQMDVDTYAPIYKMAQKGNWVDKVVSESELKQMLSQGDAHVTRDMAIPISVVGSVNADGTAAHGAHGEQLYEKKYALLKPQAQITLDPETRQFLVDHKAQGFVNGEGKAIDLPDDYEHRMSFILNAIETANTQRWGRQDAIGFANGQKNTLHNDTVPKVQQPASSKMPEISDAGMANKIDAAAKKYGLDPAVFRGMILTENRQLDAKAVSKKGAVGLGQLMPATSARYGVKDATDPEQNLDASAHYLSDLVKSKGGVDKALAAYHGIGSDGITTDQQYVQKIFGMAGLEPGGGVQEQEAQKPLVPQADAEKALDQLSPDDWKVFQRAGGVAGFTDGKPGTPSSAMKLVESGKLDPQAAGRIMQVLNKLHPGGVEQFRMDRERQQEQQRSDIIEARGERSVQAKADIERQEEQRMQDYLQVPENWEGADANLINKKPQEVKAELASKGVKTPDNLAALVAIARGEADLKTLPQKHYKGTNTMDAANGLTYIRNFLNPAYNESDYHAMAQFNTELQSSKNGSAGGALMAAGIAANHMELLAQNAEGLANRDVQVINRMANAMGVQIGKSPAVTFKAISDILNQEVGKVVAGSTPLEAELKKLTDNLNPMQSPKQIHDVLDAYVHLMQGRITEIDDRSQQTLHREIRVSPQTARVFGARGLDVPGWGTPVSDPKSHKLLGFTKDGGKTYVPIQ